MTREQEEKPFLGKGSFEKRQRGKKSPVRSGGGGKRVIKIYVGRGGGKEGFPLGGSRGRGSATKRKGDETAKLGRQKKRKEVGGAICP